MIDYIINNDKTMLVSTSDKEMMEDIKKTISNLKIEKSKIHNEITIPIFKSLYHFFRDDFSSSCLMKIVEKVNVVLNESQKYNDDVSHNKDRFTYQNYLGDKLKNFKDSFTEINDMEVFKALIYLCNKNLKSKGNKCDADFESILKENIKSFEYEEELENSVKKLFDIVENDNKCKNYISKKLDKLFADTSKINDGISNNTDNYSKIIDTFYQSREDEIDKIISKLQKCDAFPEAFAKNSSTVWFYFRLLFYFNLLNNDVYMSDEVFWKHIMNFCTDNAQEKPPQPPRPKLKKGRKALKIDKRLSLKPVEKPKPIVRDNTLYDNPSIRSIVIRRINESKPVFRITSDESKNALKKKETKIIISNNTILDPNNNIDKMINPKKVNVAQGNIIINNYYNFINPIPQLDINSIKQLHELTKIPNDILYVKPEDIPIKNSKKKKVTKEADDTTTVSKPQKSPRKKKIPKEPKTKEIKLEES